MEQIMDMTFLSISLTLPILLSLGAMGYLQNILRRVLTEICGTEDRGEFWIRCATLLSLFGAMILVLGFGPSGSGEHLVDDLRRVLTLALIGGFIGVAWISRTIWNSLMKCPETRSRLFGAAELHNARNAPEQAKVEATSTS
jgi:hypothetical protein